MTSFFEYIGVFFISAFFAEAYRQSEIKRNFGKSSVWRRVFYVLLILLLPVLLACIRKGIGADYDVYDKMFELSYTSNAKTYFFYFPYTEIGNYGLFKLGYFIGGDSQSIFALYSIITLTLFCIDMLYFKDRMPLFWCFFVMYVLYYSATYNTIRQMLAVAISLFSLRFIENKKFIPFILIIIVAMLFHSTAMIMIIFYFLYNRRSTASALISKITLLILILLPFIVIFLYRFGGSLPVIGRYFEFYDLSFNGSFAVDFVIRVVLYIFWVQFLGYDIAFDQRNQLYYYMLLADFEFVVLSFFFTWAFRFSYYTSFAQIILVGNRIKSSANRETRLSKGIFYFVLYAAVFWLLVVFWERDKIIPYISVFS